MITNKELLDLLHGEKADAFRLFDEMLGDCATRFASHIQRSYENLEPIVAGPLPPERDHWSLAALYLWEGATSLMGAFSTLRQGYPIQALDLGRRLVEASSVAVWLRDHPQQARDRRMTKMKPSDCVSYAKKHMPNIGRSYNFSSLFDHAHSALMLPCRKDSEPAIAYYPVGPLGVKERPGLFQLAAFRLLADAHNLDGVVEMLFYHGLKGEKRYWAEVGAHIEYRPITEEAECERATSAAIKEANVAFEAELIPAGLRTEKKKNGS